MAELLAHRLIRPSCIPPPAIQARPDLTRTRVALVQTRSQAKYRVTTVREDADLKCSSVVADLFGASGRRMLAALMAGEREPTGLAALARGRLRRKLSPLEVALTGPLPPSMPGSFKGHCHIWTTCSLSSPALAQYGIITP